METIIYIYKKRDLQKPETDVRQINDYLLVRIGMNVGEDRWFSHSPKPSDKISAVDGPEPEHKLTLRQRLKIRRERREAARLQRSGQNRFLREIDLVRGEIQSFLSELSRLVDDRYDCHCVYGDSVRRCLMASSSETHWLPAVWQEYWRIPEFDDYLRPEWVEPLLTHVGLHHFVVLGTAPCVPMVFSRCVRRMKSLRWFLQEQDCTEEIQDFVEDFYEDCGLAIALQPLEGKRVYTRLLLETTEAVCVLDFTGEPHVPAGGVAEGSIWIDFCSVEEKARRISERGESISYFSMKEIWKHADKP